MEVSEMHSYILRNARKYIRGIDKDLKLNLWGTDSWPRSNTKATLVEDHEIVAHFGVLHFRSRKLEHTYFC